MSRSAMDEQLSLELPDDFQFTEDQERVVELYFQKGRVCVGAGAGTGKTTTLARTVAEVVLRKVGPDISQIEQNPFEDILVCTFTRDAAADLKAEIEEVLLEHQKLTQTRFDGDLWSWLDNQSNIGTIDSFVREQLRRSEIDVGMVPRLEAPTPLEQQELVGDIFTALQADPAYSEAVQTLETAFVGHKQSVPDFIHTIQQKLRSMGHPVAERGSNEDTSYFSDQIRFDLYQGISPPFTEEDLLEISLAITGETPGTEPDLDSKSKGVASDYRFSIEFTEAVEEVLSAFDGRYRQRIRESGLASYQDITHMVRAFLSSEAGEELAESLNQQFSDIFVDEFQDTSPIQLEVLSYLVNNDRGSNRILLIGDLKQGIYDFRSAQPSLFADILEHAEASTGAPDPHLGATDWVRAELDTNFRSHPHLVWAGNHLFDAIFTDDARGAFGTGSTTPGPLIPHREEVRPELSRIRAVPVDNWPYDSPEQVARAVRQALDDDSLTIGTGADERSLTPDDFLFLFRRKRDIEDYREACESMGLSTVFVRQEGLFGQAEISYTISILQWLVGTDGAGSLKSVLTAEASPIAGESVEHVEANGWDLQSALDGWDMARFSDADEVRLTRLLKLQTDLRWEREGPKAELLEMLISQGGIETSLLTASNGTQRYENLRRLVEVVREWEIDGLISYQEFVDRLGKLRRMATETNDASYRLAVTSDPESDQSLNFGTMHGAKGLEHACIVLADLDATAGAPPFWQTLFRYRDETSDSEELAILPRNDPDTQNTAFDHGPGEVWLANDEKSTLVPADDREDDSGELVWDHPFQSGWKNTIEEFWRLLYVAYTRASEYLFFEAPESVDQWYRWKSMAAGLNGVLQPKGGWKSDEGSRTTAALSLDASTQNSRDEATFESIPLGIQQLSSRSPEPQRQTDHSELLQKAVLNGSPGPSATSGLFTPRELKANNIHHILACPARYQFAVLQSVSDSRGRSFVEVAAPAGMSASEWGTRVHAYLKHEHEQILQRSDSSPGGQLGLRRAGKPELNRLLTAYEKTNTWEEVCRASSVHAELDLRHTIGADPATIVRGTADLLYQESDAWTVVDFKTGKESAPGSYRSNRHRSQLRAYAWMLGAQYGISVSAGRLIYLGTGHERDVPLDIDAFDAQLEQIVEGLPLDTTAGLAPRPHPEPSSTAPDQLPADTRCGSCPYSDICPAWKD